MTQPSNLNHIHSPAPKTYHIQRLSPISHIHCPSPNLPYPQPTLKLPISTAYPQTSHIQPLSPYFPYPQPTLKPPISSAYSQTSHIQRLSPNFPYPTPFPYASHIQRAPPPLPYPAPLMPKCPISLHFVVLGRIMSTGREREIEGEKKSV